MNRYSFVGSVMQFGRCVDPKWKGETVAPTEKKALSNLAYQYKTQVGLLPSTKITLDGKLKVMN